MRGSRDSRGMNGETRPADGTASGGDDEGRDARSGQDAAGRDPAGDGAARPPGSPVPASTGVLVVGAGPVGLMTAIELRRRGVDVTIVDAREEIPPWAKAIGVQPRTLEHLDQAGVARAALDEAIALRGQLVYGDGELRRRIELELPDDVPYRFVAIPQYAVEHVLERRLRELGSRVARGVRAVSIEPGDEGVACGLAASGPAAANATGAAAAALATGGVLRARYVVGCDGAHSTVRKALGLAFDGDAFPETYMLADVELDWGLAPGYAVRSSRLVDGTEDGLVCIPLPGTGRYRVSMLAPERLVPGAGGSASARASASTSPSASAPAAPSASPAASASAPTPAPADGIAHGVDDTGAAAPSLADVQAVLDRLSPVPTRASALRWSSVFRISHRLVERYAVGRVLLAGDAAHIHPPTGAQGMNTGLQDAVALAWRLALAVQDRAAEGLLDSYHAERHPIGEEVVGRTVRAARTGGVGASESALLREAQLLIDYAGSPVVAADALPGSFAGGPEPGTRAPDARGLRQDPVAGAMRVHELLRHPGHTLLLWAHDADGLGRARALAAHVAGRFGGDVRTNVVIAREAACDDLSGILLRDADGEFAAAYGFAGPTTGPSTAPDADSAAPDADAGATTAPGAVGACLVRPDGYVGLRSPALSLDELDAYFARILRA